MEPIKVLTANIDKPNSASIETYLQGGGYEHARKALTTMARLDRWDTPFPAPEPAKDDV